MALVAASSGVGIAVGKLSGLGAALRGSQVCNASPSSEVLRILLSKLSGLEDLAEGLEELLAVGT